MTRDMVYITLDVIAIVAALYLLVFKIPKVFKKNQQLPKNDKEIPG